jgi:hypothetical protein
MVASDGHNSFISFSVIHIPDSDSFIWITFFSVHLKLSQSGMCLFEKETKELFPSKAINFCNLLNHRRLCRVKNILAMYIKCGILGT